MEQHLPINEKFRGFEGILPKSKVLVAEFLFLQKWSWQDAAKVLEVVGKGKCEKLRRIVKMRGEVGWERLLE